MRIPFESVELDGVRYAILREDLFREVCSRAGIAPFASMPRAAPDAEIAGIDLNLDREPLAKKLVLRRKRAGLTQAELARRAGIRAETLNRVERGHTSPDFSTIRKLIVAINEADAESAAATLAGAAVSKEMPHGKDG